MTLFTTYILILTALLAPLASAHTWIEWMFNVDTTGTFTGAPGFPRGYSFRNDTAVDPNTAMVWELPDQEANILDNTQNLCKSTQLTPDNPTDLPLRLSAPPGGRIALLYQENGHVTLPQNIVGKPSNRGTVFIYGTTQPSDDEKLLDVHYQWTQDGTGGNGKGQLVAAQDFDDGRCYQVNTGNISTARQAEFPQAQYADITDPPQQGALWCQNDFVLPKTLKDGDTYTLYWVWDWPTLPNDATAPIGVLQLYTTCMDINIVGTAQDVDPDTPVANTLNGVATQAILTHTQFDAQTTTFNKILNYGSVSGNAGAVAAATSGASSSATKSAIADAQKTSAPAAGASAASVSTPSISVVVDTITASIPTPTPVTPVVATPAPTEPTAVSVAAVSPSSSSSSSTPKPNVKTEYVIVTETDTVSVYTTIPPGAQATGAAAGTGSQESIVISENISISESSGFSASVNVQGGGGGVKTRTSFVSATVTVTSSSCTSETTVTATTVARRKRRSL
jgi:hypothetical protein